MTCATCRHFEPRNTASVAADGECRWDAGPFWLALVRGPGKAFVNRSDGDGCSAYARKAEAQRPAIRKDKTYTRTSTDA